MRKRKPTEIWAVPHDRTDEEDPESAIFTSFSTKEEARSRAKKCDAKVLGRFVLATRRIWAVRRGREYVSFASKEQARSYADHYGEKLLGPFFMS
jgi:hypothetical protein